MKLLQVWTSSIFEDFNIFPKHPPYYLCAGIYCAGHSVFAGCYQCYSYRYACEIIFLRKKLTYPDPVAIFEDVCQN